jgi:hypothetical protein
MENKTDYNCNTVNVADPASTCPTCNGPEGCRSFSISVDTPLDPPIIQFKINILRKRGRSLTDNSSLDYTINLPGPPGGGPVVLTGGIPDGINKMPHGKKIEGLSKTSVLQNVFSVMEAALSAAGLAAVGRGSDYSNILQTYIDNPHNIEDIIRVFCLKLFGDFGQELYSVHQSYSGPSVYIGNDWISYIRYLFLKKYSEPGTVIHPWYGGFLGNKYFNIIYEKGASSRPSSPVRSPKQPRIGSLL